MISMHSTKDCIVMKRLLCIVLTFYKIVSGSFVFVFAVWMNKLALAR